MWSPFKERRRRQLRSQQFPEPWRRIIETNVSFFTRLSSPDRDELIGHLQVFLAEKHFEGCAGVEITDEIRLTIASQACLLLLHRKTDYFPFLITILVYPTTYLAEENRHLHGEVWQEGAMPRSGETGRLLNTMVLAWDAVQYGAADASDGKNVVLHEFAHQLDFENHATDGTPALETRQQQLTWAQVMRTEFASLRAADVTGIPTLLDTYGATNPAEFFAVAVEAFFEQPYALKTQHPRLYSELQQFFRQDPLQYSSELKAGA